MSLDDIVGVACAVVIAVVIVAMYMKIRAVKRDINSLQSEVEDLINKKGVRND